MGKKNPVKPDENGEADMVEEDGTSKAGKKGKRQKKKDFDEDDIARELEDMSLEMNGELPKQKDVSDDGKSKEVKDKKSKKASKNDGDSESDEGIQPTIGGGFAALMEDNDTDMTEVEEVKKEAKPSKEMKKYDDDEEKSRSDKSKKEKPKKKSKRKGRDEDDEDIDDILAELEAEYKGEKVEDKEPSKNAVKKETEAKVVETNQSQDATKLKQTKEETKLSEKKMEKASLPKKEVKASEVKKDTKKKDVKIESKEVPEKVSQPAKLSASGNDKIKAGVKEDSPKPEEKDDSKKKKASEKGKDKKKDEEDSKAKKGKPTKKALEGLRQMLAKQKEEEERLRKEEEERERQEEERIRQILEQQRLEEERKEKLKQKQKERNERLKKEGKLLTPKQKMEQKRAKAMLQHLKEQGFAVPQAGEKHPPSSASYKRHKRKPEEAKIEEKEQAKSESVEVEEQVEEQEAEKEKVEEEEDDDVVDAWELISEDEDEESSEPKDENKKAADKIEVDKRENEKEESDSEHEEELRRRTEGEKKRDRAIQRMDQRKAQNEKNKSEQRLRSPVVCVLGHVDHGKTKILDKLRRTHVQEGEVGGITQQIGATNVPFEAIASQTRMVKDFDVATIKLPGLLIIDTPGHESFSNLRSRGSSLCDIAILVVDITQGLEPQTLESISLLKAKKTPFVVALNKVDRVFDWESHPNKDIRDIITLQGDASRNDFQRRTGEVIQALNMQGLNAALFWENPDPRSYASLVPTSAITGDGMGNLISLITTSCQKRLQSRFRFSDELQCTVLEVKTIQGHGTTIDVILVNGRLNEGDTIVLAGTEGPIVTQIRSLLIPKPMKEIRVKGQYDELKTVEAALGVKVAARDLEKAIAGLNLQVAYHEDEINLLKEQVDKEFKSAMRSIKVKDKGVYVQASTLGALEALLEFFKANKVPYAGIRVGPVVKKDVMKAAAMLEHDPMYAVILAFDVKVERDAQELADKEGVKIFVEETIYHLGDRYVEYLKDYKRRKQEEFRHVAVFPCRLKIIPDAIFNKRDPIVLGVTVEAGILRTGTPLCVPSKEYVDIGVVTSLEFDHKVVEIAKKGVSVCMKVDNVPGHTPKLFGRHFEAEDMLVSKISRESIDACKEYFRDDLGKTEWKLMAELKKQFGIL